MSLSSGPTISESAATAALPSAARVEAPVSRQLRILLLRVAQRPSALLGLLIVLAWIVGAAAWPLLAPHDPSAINLSASFSSPSLHHLFGTDDLGRDVFSRVLAGSRSVLLIATVATFLGVALGTTLGLVVGYYRGIMEELLMRTMDIVMAFPLIVVSLLVLAVLGPSKLNIILIVAIVFAPYNARVIRSAVLTERERDFIAAARMRGEAPFYVMFVEILPNIVGTIVVELTIRLALAIFTVATLSFLGLGIQPPTPDWGLMISQARQFYRIAPWMVLFPSLAIASLVIAINLIAEGLRRR
jgi:peptide/nickel transport system permease protein